MIKQITIHKIDKFVNMNKNINIFNQKRSCNILHSYKYSTLIRKHFDRELHTKHRNVAAKLEGHDYIFDEIAGRLSDRINDILSRDFENILDIGCRKGNLSRHLIQRDKLKKLVLMDSSENMVHRALDYISPLNKNNVEIEGVICDEENLPFENEQFDMVISNLNLHWVNDLPGTFSKINSILKPDGVFLATFFGDQSLHELQNAFMLGEQEREGGLSPHCSPFVGVSDIGNLLTRTKFTLPTVDCEEIQVNFENAFILMRELGAMGEGNSVTTRRKDKVLFDTLLATSAIYQGFYEDEKTKDISSSFQIIYLIGWKEHHSQQKPKERGSADFSLKELSEQMEVPLGKIEEE